MRTFVFFCLFVSSFATVFQDCGSFGTDVILTIEGCDIPPCHVKRNESYSCRFQYTQVVTSDTLTVNATASIGGIEVPWIGIETNACTMLEGSSNPCPLEDGSAVDLEFKVDILKEYPKITTVGTFRLVDDMGGTQLCARIPINVE